MRKALIAGLVLSLGLVFAAPASADPTRSASASAFALEATGLVPITRTPVVTASAPPDSGLRRAILEVPAQPLVTSATGAAQAEGRVLQTLPSTLPGVQGGNNSRGHAIVENLNLLVSPAGAPVPAVLQIALIEAEAVARCVGRTAVFDTGSRRSVILLNGAPVQLVDDVLNIPFDLLNPTGALAAVISFSENETGTLPGGGVFVDALVIRILSGVIGQQQTQTVRVSHAEARMPTPCDPVAGPGNPGPAAAGLDLGPGAPLPRTGSNEMLAVPVALGMLATAVALRQLNRRARRANA